MTLTVLSNQPEDSSQFSIEDLVHRPGVYLVEITPEDAAKLLERNTNNRPRKARAVEDYARLMKDGRWHVTNQGIGISRTGELLDGQNRLGACVRAGVPFRTMLATGLDAEAKSGIDVGVKRTMADAFRMGGYQNTMVLSGGVSARMRYDELVAEGTAWRSGRGSGWGGMRRDHGEAIEYLEQHPTMVDACAQAWRWRKTFPKVPLSVPTAFESMVMEHEHLLPDLAYFRDGVMTGAMLAAQDPRLLLRNLMTRLDRAPHGLWLLGVVIKSWNLYLAGDTRELLSFRDIEPMPRLGTTKDDAARSLTARRRTTDAA